MLDEKPGSGSRVVSERHSHFTTEWQKSQLPYFQKHCQVIFDGIDLTNFKPNVKSQRKNIITYGTENG